MKFPHPEGVEAGTTAAQLAGLAVNNNSTHKDVALDFIKFASGPEGAKIVADTGTLPAIRTDDVAAKITGLSGFPQDQASKDAMKSGKSYLEWLSAPMPRRSKWC